MLQKMNQNYNFKLALHGRVCFEFQPVKQSKSKTSSYISWTCTFPSSMVCSLGMTDCVQKVMTVRKLQRSPGFVLVLMKEEEPAARQLCAFVHLPCFPY